MPREMTTKGSAMPGVVVAMLLVWRAPMTEPLLSTKETSLHRLSWVSGGRVAPEVMLHSCVRSARVGDHDRVSG